MIDAIHDSFYVFLKKIVCEPELIEHEAVCFVCEF